MSDTTGQFIRVYPVVTRNPLARKVNGKPGPIIWRAKVEGDSRKWAEGSDSRTALRQLHYTYPDTASLRVETED